VKNGPDLALENPALQKYTPVASPAFDADVSTQTKHLPLVAAAGVLLA
jgi:hypothetical protein